MQVLCLCRDVVAAARFSSRELNKLVSKATVCWVAPTPRFQVYLNARHRRAYYYTHEIFATRKCICCRTASWDTVLLPFAMFILPLSVSV